VAVALFAVALPASGYGRCMIALRDDELASGTADMPVVRMKILAFVIANALAGLSGSLPRGMVPDRMARRRTRTDPVLSLHAARDHQPPCPGGRHQATLAERAGLPGSQAGTGAWPLGGARLAWLASSRHTVHRRLRVPALRQGSDSPLRTTQHPSHRKICLTRRLSTPRIARSDLSVTCRTRSQRSESLSPAPSLATSPAAPLPAYQPYNEFKTQ
jgi:hypothetical protein